MISQSINITNAVAAFLGIMFVSWLIITVLAKSFPDDSEQ